MELKYLKNVSSLSLNSSRCTGCGMCLQVCPHAVFRLADRKAVILDSDLCMECGACAMNCPRGAITVRAGVGCAAALIQGKLRGTGPDCGCSNGGKACCG
jgi:NAD-dependent dihydropyrimidine dehydrogenase PreA subunit